MEGSELVAHCPAWGRRLTLAAETSVSRATLRWPPKDARSDKGFFNKKIRKPETKPFDTASTLDGIIWGRFLAIGPYGVSPFPMRSLHTVYPAVDLAEKPRIGV